MKNKRRNHKFMVLKLDMAKAYDRGEWMGFRETFVSWIMQFTYKFNINGEIVHYKRNSNYQ